MNKVEITKEEINKIMNGGMKFQELKDLCDRLGITLDQLYESINAVENTGDSYRDAFQSSFEKCLLDSPYNDLFKEIIVSLTALEKGCKERKKRDEDDKFEEDFINAFNEIMERLLKDNKYHLVLSYK